jgi:malonyl-CoA/methylmalonyl-CoA synthetase
VNIVLCCLASRASLILPPTKFDPLTIMELLQTRATIFMAVPTVYHKLLAAIKSLPESEQASLKEALRARVRLMVCGSAALPLPMMSEWATYTVSHSLSPSEQFVVRAIVGVQRSQIIQHQGHCLLERYGMSEIGMALSNSLGLPSARHSTLNRAMVVRLNP